MMSIKDSWAIVGLFRHCAFLEGMKKFFDTVLLPRQRCIRKACIRYAISRLVEFGIRF